MWTWRMMETISRSRKTYLCTAEQQKRLWQHWKTNRKRRSVSDFRWRRCVEHICIHLQQLPFSFQLLLLTLTLWIFILLTQPLDHHVPLVIIYSPHYGWQGVQCLTSWMSSGFRPMNNWTHLPARPLTTRSTASLDLNSLLVLAQCMLVLSMGQTTVTMEVFHDWKSNRYQYICSTTGE